MDQAPDSDQLETPPEFNHRLNLGFNNLTLLVEGINPPVLHQ